MSAISDDRSYTVCDLDGCDNRKPGWSNLAGEGANAWYVIETWNGHRTADYCCREHAVEALGGQA